MYSTYFCECSSIDDPSETEILLYWLDPNDFSDFVKLLFIFVWLLLFLCPSLLPLPSITLPFEGTGCDPCGDILPANVFSVCNILTRIANIKFFIFLQVASFCKEKIESISKIIIIIIKFNLTRYVPIFTKITCTVL